jgi:hypothetical protein
MNRAPDESPFLLSAALLGLALGCTSSPSSPSYGTPQDCIEAGGRCILGPGILCAKQGPENTCNCNPLCSTGGQFCCVAFIDAGDAEVP